MPDAPISRLRPELRSLVHRIGELARLVYGGLSIDMAFPEDHSGPGHEQHQPDGSGQSNPDFQVGNARQGFLPQIVATPGDIGRRRPAAPDAPMVRTFDEQGNQGIPDIEKYSCQRRNIAAPNSVRRGRKRLVQVETLALARQRVGACYQGTCWALSLTLKIGKMWAAACTRRKTM